MAEYQGAARDHQQQRQPGNAFVLVPDRRNQQLCLDAGRALLLCGALVTGPTAFDFGPANANTKHVAFVGFLLWILGACLCLLALTPAAQWAVRAGAAVASTLLKCLTAPVNY